MLECIHLPIFLGQKDVAFTGFLKQVRTLIGQCRRLCGEWGLRRRALSQ